MTRTAEMIGAVLVGDDKEKIRTFGHGRFLNSVCLRYDWW